MLVPLLLSLFSFLQEPSIQERVRFQLVRVPVWVADRRGMPRSELRARDFRLEVDGKPVAFHHFRETGEQPLELVFLLDLSGSMALGGRLQASIQTITVLADASRPDDHWTLFVFGDGHTVRFLDKSKAAHWPELQRALRGYGKTSLHDALAITDTFFSSEHHENKALVLFTDGNDNNSRIDETRMLEILSVLEVPVFVVAIADRPLPEGEPPPKWAILEDIAHVSGGRIFWIGGSHTIHTVWGRLERSLRAHYVLGFTVERGSSDRPHQITVQLPRKRRLEVRSRRGYVGSLPSPGG